VSIGGWKEIWCSRGHPVEMNGLIRRMPAVDPIATWSRSVEKNLRVLRLRWEYYMGELDKEMLAKRYGTEF
jgi:hypothetical protein